MSDVTELRSDCQQYDHGQSTLHSSANKLRVVRLPLAGATTPSFVISSDSLWHVYHRSQAPNQDTIE